ncbi:MAG TPA: hypothetical protein VMP11_00550 [Verrucomicrobiae bacterium]|nr:hypothetical protein [Verrucomicrobiae bacterium]
MSESRRLGQDWTDPELIAVLDMYFNGHFTDSHGHDEFAKCLGRYNPNTNSHSDGAVNEKLAEIKGHIEGSRAHRHPGASLIALIDRYSDNHRALRVAAAEAWRDIVREYSGEPPSYVQDLLDGW